MKLRVKKIHELAKLPIYGHAGDAGMDLFSVEDLTLEPGQAVPVPTGIQVAISEGYVGLVWDKSGISLKGVHRLAGVIDSGYRGEIKVVMINLSEEPFQVEKGKK
ncbi:dUTP diphosphatase, partial [Acidobacteriota bacterium]